MQYHNVCLEGAAYSLPDEVITSLEVERRLQPAYQRLGLSEGRLEFMTGISQRRFWPRGTMPSEKSAETARKVLETAGIDVSEIGALVHGSVSRDQLEPATACRVHDLLGLRAECQVYDVSNACLGLLNGIVQVANLIELGEIRAALVVGTESARSLVESTIAQLNADTSLSRAALKPAFASLTIGSASAAVLLVHRELSTTHNRLGTATARAFTRHHRLCQGGEAAHDSCEAPMLMQTDAEALLRAGIESAAETFAAFLLESSWKPGEITRTIGHQVGAAHRKQLLEALGLDATKDFCLFETLGNTGAVAVPVTLAVALERGLLVPRDRLALLGIGSGLNVLMLGVDCAGARQRAREPQPAVTRRAREGSDPA